MRVLCDRHHAGLLYSLQLLFEDRLGLELYVPVGREWWDEGYWRFGQVFGDDRLARQYLETEGHEWKRDWLHEHGQWVTWDVEFPQRLIRGVTLEQFKELGEWRFVTATVQENQPGFARLAREAGAAHVYQVGNRGQYVNWDLEPIALVSAEADIPAGARAVRYRQEYDKDGVFAFRPAEPGIENTIRSFVNCFDRIPEQWRFMQQVERLLPDVYFRVHGHDGRDGLVQPTADVAIAMAASGFGWHDKPQGDGFGHIIHYWASIGRPLIGHASYYAGLMPGPLWEDGVTAVLLDGRRPEDAAQRIAEIVWDTGQHKRMCCRIRERLDELVDFDADELRIREVLGL